MGDAFPSDRKQKREALLNEVDKTPPVLQISGAESEELGKLSSEAVAALRTMGMVKDPVTEMMVLEQLAYHDLTSAWCTMVGATGIASLGTFLPQSGLEKVFTDGNLPTATMSFFPPDGQKGTEIAFVRAVGGDLTAVFTSVGPTR